MNRNQRIARLVSLGWTCDETAAHHLICNERCDWVAGKIGSVEWSAWISQVSGMVYLHGVPSVPGEYDLSFDAFCLLVRDGWPKPKVAPAARGLFDDSEE